MFSTLETTWDRSGRRGWTTFASFTFQALALSLLLLIPLFSIQGPPRLEWFQDLLTPPPAPAPPPAPTREHVTHPTNSNVSGIHIVQPPSIPTTIAEIHETSAPAAPDLDHGPGVPGGTGTSRNGVMNSLGPAVDVAPPAHTGSKPLKISRWSEGNLVYRVKPAYPPIAIAAHIQGQVHLRAIISKTGTIENLVVENGPPMLVQSALAAVRQWRYRPYVLNDEPTEVETEITVNFTLGGS